MRAARLHEGSRNRCITKDCFWLQLSPCLFPQLAKLLAFFACDKRSVVPVEHGRGMT